MGIKNPIQSDGMYFLTLTVVQWIDIFTRPLYRHIIVDSLAYCQSNKGLTIHAWVIMSNHIHLIASTEKTYHLSDILRDFKKYTSKAIITAIQEGPESRSYWMLNQFSFAASTDKKVKEYKFWQEGNEAKEILSAEFMIQKLEYIHQNPVRAEIVDVPESYLYSSAIDYAGGKGLLALQMLT
jgi:putative transposase